jgi:hypothetical protein
MARSLVTAVALAALLLIAAPAVVLAECMDWPIGVSEDMHARYAFTATVTEAWSDSDHSDDGPEFDWRTELTVTRTYRGHLRDRIVSNGWYFGCHFLHGDRLRAGDRLFVASSAFRPRADGLDPFTVLDGQVVVWKRSGDHWKFFEDGLDYGSDKAYYPTAARTARTTADILQVISGESVPDTSTVSVPHPGSEAPISQVLITTFVAGLLLGVVRTRSRRTALPGCPE